MMVLCPAGHVHSALLTDDRIPDDLRAVVGPSLEQGARPEEVVAEVTRVLAELRSRSRARHPTARRFYLNRWTRGEDGRP